VDCLQRFYIHLSHQPRRTFISDRTCDGVTVEAHTVPESDLAYTATLHRSFVIQATSRRDHDLHLNILICTMARQYTCFPQLSLQISQSSAVALHLQTFAERIKDFMLLYDRISSHSRPHTHSPVSMRINYLTYDLYS